MIIDGQILEALSIDLDAGVISLLETYSEELIKWNRKINLTGARTVESFIQGPLFDALTLLTVIEKEGTLVDVGSGGGLPGIPAAIAAPNLKVTLAEPRAKRASFLRHAVHRLGIKAEITESRDETLPSNHWDAAVAQAVWPPNVWLEHAQKLVKPGGAIYILSSDTVDPDDLPSGTSMEQAKTLTRPFDTKKRYCTLVRI